LTYIYSLSLHDALPISCYTSICFPNGKASVPLSGDSKLSKRMSTLAATFQNGDTAGRKSLKGSTVLIAQFKKHINDPNKSETDKDRKSTRLNSSHGSIS